MFRVVGEGSKVAEDGPCDKCDEYRYRSPSAVGKAPQPRMRACMRCRGKGRNHRQGKEYCCIVMPCGGDITVHQCMQSPERTAAGAVVAGEHVRGTMRHPSGILRVVDIENHECSHSNYSGQRHKYPPPMPQPRRARYRRRCMWRRSHPSGHCQAPECGLNNGNDYTAYNAEDNGGNGPDLGVLRCAICTIVVAANPFVIDLCGIDYGHYTQRQTAENARGYGPSEI